jgi:4-diphosphocytidyl-2-C-methyl-D-erythritol kinase
MLTLKAPAKINLTLEVLAQRVDGYHEIRSVLQTISLCDVLRLENADDIKIMCDMRGWIAEKSLVIRVIDLLKKATGYSKGVTVVIEKHLPLMSGLGGDSSDAAALLSGLDKLWSLGLSSAKLAELTAQLGSDVTFFLHGGTAEVKGRGEIVIPLPALPMMWAVVVIPRVSTDPNKTKRMYSSLNQEHYTRGVITQELVENLHKGEVINSSLLFNTFENIAFKDKVLKIQIEHLTKLGAMNVHLAGSGPTLFSLFSGREQAEEIYRRCIRQGMNVFLATTL